MKKIIKIIFLINIYVIIFTNKKVCQKRTSPMTTMTTMATMITIATITILV